jgi:hypothetical protein
VKARQRRQEEPFATVPLEAAAKVAKAVKVPAIAVYVHLVYLSWKTKSSTVALSNHDGVHRNSKDRVLRNFEKAGVIRVKRHRGRSPRVTILHRLPWC